MAFINRRRSGDLFVINFPPLCGWPAFIINRSSNRQQALLCIVHRPADNRAMRESMQRISIGLLVIGLAACVDETPDALQQRVVAIGDIHADIDAARRAFQIAGAVDADDNWIGGDLVVVQLGDFIGRSYQDRQVLEYLLALREEATTGGGELHALIGNHEVFGARLELRWVPDEAFADFNRMPGLDLEHPRLTTLPEYQRARSAALMPGGYYSKQLAEFPAILRLGDTIFVHGGVTPHWARYGVDKINDEISRWFAGEIGEPTATLGMDPGNFDDSVMMSRHFSRDVDEAACEMLEESLRMLGAKRMVVAHSVHDSIRSYCDDQVWVVDVGMSRYYGGTVQVLEIINDDSVSVIRN
jgi:hypothetical protein